MENSIFFIENPNILTIDDYKNLRKLYLPLIGINSVLIYEYLLDISENSFRKSFKFSEICDLLEIDIIRFEESIYKLEAVNLISTFKNNKGNHFIFEAKKPYNIEKFNKNPIFKSHLIKKIGENEYKNILFFDKRKLINKTNYENISKKYQDVFVNEFEQIIKFNEDYSTLEINIQSFESHDENIEKLPSTYFIKYLMKRNPSFYETQLINSLLNLGFNDSSINLFLDFSFKFNEEQIICPYIMKIANDFISRSITDFNDVKYEISIIEIAKMKKKNKLIRKNNEDKNKILFGEEVDNNESISNIDEIFTDDEIKGIF